MPASTAIENILKGLIEKEDEASIEYGRMAEEAPKSNIKWFLSSFSEARKKTRDKITKILEERVDDDFDYQEEEILHIHATEHLTHNGDVDPDSLHSVLLYISKKEQEDLENFKMAVKGVKNEKLLGLLDSIMREKETVHTKADRLYHDMVETF